MRGWTKAQIPGGQCKDRLWDGVGVLYLCIGRLDFSKSSMLARLLRWLGQRRR